MIAAFHSAGLGLAANQQRIDDRAQNIANTDTVAYNAQETEFSDTLYAYYAQDGKEIAAGTGVKPVGTVSFPAQGAPEKTGRSLDLMIEGDGYFCVQDANGGLSYTRAGAFQRSEDGWLTTAGGCYVLDGQLQRIPIEDEKAVSFSVSSSGGNGSAAEIGVFTFANPSGLVRQGENLLGASPSSGTAVQTATAEIRQGYLERSTVDLAAEMSRMIQAQRGFQANARMIRAADEIEETANQLRS
ncbi:MAG: flagellar hook-basal body protein [Clostridiaceae bacterium]|nr:flagellar hook-basal body protein [Clostridiaceae bacterium]